MAALIGYIILIIGNLISFSVPALVAAWFLPIISPLTFEQGLWLSLGTIITVQYIIQTITDLPGYSGYGPIQILFSVAGAYILLVFSGLAAWLFLWLLPVDLTFFQTMLLFIISLGAGFFFLGRSGTGGLPNWMTLPHIDPFDEDFEDEYTVSPPPKRRTPKKKSGRR